MCFECVTQFTTRATSSNLYLYLLKKVIGILTTSRKSVVHFVASSSSSSSFISPSSTKQQLQISTHSEQDSTALAERQ